MESFFSIYPILIILVEKTCRLQKFERGRHYVESGSMEVDVQAVANVAVKSKGLPQKGDVDQHIFREKKKKQNSLFCYYLNQFTWVE